MVKRVLGVEAGFRYRIYALWPKNWYSMGKDNSEVCVPYVALWEIDFYGFSFVQFRRNVPNCSPV